MKPLEENDTFQYELCYCFVTKRQRIVWGYKDNEGVVHSGIVDFPEEALEKAKGYGYQLNETTERKLQQDLVIKLQTHRLPIKKKRYILLKTLIAVAITLEGFIIFFPETIGKTIGRSLISYQKSQRLKERKRVLKEKLGEKIPLEVYACFKKAHKIKYKSDGKGEDYWQTPEETKEKGEGDCEDIAFYLYDLFKKEGVESEIVTGFDRYHPKIELSDYIRDTKKIRRGGLHAWNEYEYNKEKWILDATKRRILKRKIVEEETPRMRHIRLYERLVGITWEMKEKEKQLQEFIKEYYNSTIDK